MNDSAFEVAQFAGRSLQRPYSPSWLDHFTAWVDRIPIHPVAFYAGLAGVLVLIQHIIQWNAGQYAAGTFEPFHVYFSAITPYFVGLVHYLDKVAARAWDAFLPAINTDVTELTDLEYRLTTLPARSTLIAGFCGVVFAIVSLIVGGAIREQLHLIGMATTQVSVTLNTLLYLTNWSVVGTITYHVIHQLGVVNQIYRHTYIDLYHLGPLYAFSGLSARTAVGVAIAMYSPVFILSGFGEYPIWTIVRVLAMTVVLVTFVWPLLGIHRLLEREKDRKLRENARLMDATFTQLHKSVEREDLPNLEDLNRAIDALQVENRTLKAIPTWPWRPETPRAVLAATFLPVAVWLIQWILERVLVAP